MSDLKNRLEVMGLTIEDAAMITGVRKSTMASYSCEARRVPERIIDVLNTYWKRNSNKPLDEILVDRIKLKKDIIRCRAMMV